MGVIDGGGACSGDIPEDLSVYQVLSIFQQSGALEE